MKRPIPRLILAVGWVLIKLRDIFFAGVSDLSQEFEKQTVNNSQVELDLVGAKLDDKVELPTLAIIFLVYASWITLTYFFHEISLFPALILSSLLICWHGSIQHEIIHRHPTRSQFLNDVLAFPPLGLVYPYVIYKESHLEHHRVSDLTDPVNDPESYYISTERWQRMNPCLQTLFRLNNTLLGRLLFGPLICVVGFYGGEIRRLLKGDYQNLKVWLIHLVAVALVLSWVVGVCGISPLTYLLCFVYPGLSLTLLRSFAEHRPGFDNSEKSVVVEAGLLFQILFLNNNYHWVHHRYPRLPWYRIKDVYFANKEIVLQANNDFFFYGYGDVARKFLLVEKDLPVMAEEILTEERLA